MTPEVKAAAEKLLAMAKEMVEPPNVENLSPEQLRALSNELAAKAQAKKGEMDALFEVIRNAPPPREPKQAREPDIPPRLETLQTLGGKEFSHPYVVETMLELAEITKDDVLYDLGSGDGRIVEMAADIYRIQAGGVEIGPHLVNLARERAIFRGLKSYVDYREADAETFDVSNATVVTLFLSAEGNLKLKSRLRAQLPNGARIVSNRFDMGDWKPDRIDQAKDHMQKWHKVYLWRIRK